MYFVYLLIPYYHIFCQKSRIIIDSFCIIYKGMFLEIRIFCEESTMVFRNYDFLSLVQLWIIVFENWLFLYVLVFKNSNYLYLVFENSKFLLAIFRKVSFFKIDFFCKAKRKGGLFSACCLPIILIRYCFIINYDF